MPRRCDEGVVSVDEPETWPTKEKAAAQAL